MYKSFLIKYAEIGTKGKNRHLFEDALVDNLKNALSFAEGEYEVTKEYGRIYVEAVSQNFDYDGAISAMKKVFGVAGICPMYQIEDNGFDDLAKNVIDYLFDNYPDQNFTFKVMAKRVRKNYPMSSMEINAALGEKILDAFPRVKVDVHNPDVYVHVEIRNHINIFSRVIPGPGGMPVGTAGRGMLLLSGGIDSPVAGWMVAKRGVSIDAVYFHAPPYTSERAKQKVIDLAEKIAPYTGKMQLYVVNFTDIQMYIYDKCPHDELTIIMRRYMMRIAEEFAKGRGAQGLITGESIGQVASQTTHSLAATNQVCTLPVFRPLIAFDKQEIIDVALRIGTYDTSVLPYEDCCTTFVAKHPVTKPNVEVIKRSERRLSEKIDEKVKTAVETVEIIEIG